MSDLPLELTVAGPIVEQVSEIMQAYAEANIQIITYQKIEETDDRVEEEQDNG